MSSIELSAGVLPAAGGGFGVTITFDEPPATTPTVANFAVTNGAISDIRQVGPAVFTATVTPAAGIPVAIPTPAVAGTPTAAETAAIAAAMLKQNCRH